MKPNQSITWFMHQHVSYYFIVICRVVLICLLGCFLSVTTNEIKLAFLQVRFLQLLPPPANKVGDVLLWSLFLPVGLSKKISTDLQSRRDRITSLCPCPRTVSPWHCHGRFVQNYNGKDGIDLDQRKIYTFWEWSKCRSRSVFHSFNTTRQNIFRYRLPVG